MEELAALAPLHNPANALGIRVATDLSPGKPQVAVFDTAFHQTLPPYAFPYAIPYELMRSIGSADMDSMARAINMLPWKLPAD